MILRSENGTYPETTLEHYKDTPGSWMSITRRTLFKTEDSSFQGRYFEIAPGGYSSHEKHAHEHFVVVARGTGEVLLGDTWEPVTQGDVVHVTPWTPHQFKNTGQGPFAFFCTVDKLRDRPVLLGNETDPGASD